MKSKAVSEIIGTMLMLVIIFSLSIVLFVIANSQLNLNQALIANDIEIMNRLIRERFVIEHVQKYNATSILIIINNIGDYKITIMRILIANSTFTKLFNDLFIEIDPNKNYTYIANLNTVITTGSEYKIRVESEIILGSIRSGKGNSVTYTWTPEI
jgi:archaeal flagellin N-terminal-like domain